MRKLVLALLALGCSELTAPDGAIPILPIPQEYRVWWTELEACSGLRGDVDDVRFYVVQRLTHNGFVAEGTTTRQGASTVILFRDPYQHAEPTVKHEMLHALLRVDGHPPEYFGVCAPP